MADANTPTESLHVHDLPQLYQKPSATSLLQALDLLTLTPPNFTAPKSSVNPQAPHVHESGVPAYLTSIIASPLSWLPLDDLREQIWELASLRLSERSGRTAMPAMTRHFQITEHLSVALHEPSLTGDNLGLKTWVASLLLSRRLRGLEGWVFGEESKGEGEGDGERGKRVLELGSGTGLVGISAACLWGCDVVATDLEEIVPNLRRNVDLNEEIVSRVGGSIEARALDWANEMDGPASGQDRYEVILVADPIYSSEHPKILVNAIRRWLKYSPESRLVIELPLRTHYVDERAELKELLRSSGLETVANGKETGQDDWLDEEGNPAEVECEWTIWQPK